MSEETRRLIKSNRVEPRQKQKNGNWRFSPKKAKVLPAAVAIHHGGGVTSVRGVTSMWGRGNKSEGVVTSLVMGGGNIHRGGGVAKCTQGSHS